MIQLLKSFQSLGFELPFFREEKKVHFFKDSGIFFRYLEDRGLPSAISSLFRDPATAQLGRDMGDARSVSLQKCDGLPLQSSLLLTPGSPGKFASQFFILAFWWNKNVWVTLRCFAAYPSFSLLVNKPFLPIKTSLNISTLKFWLSQLIRGATPRTSAAPSTALWETQILDKLNI